MWEQYPFPKRGMRERGYGRIVVGNARTVIAFMTFDKLNAH